jgi:DUF1365 family protein
MKTPPTGLFLGLVEHQRNRPRFHKLRYRIFMLAIPLDGGQQVAKAARFLGWNRFNLFSLYERDYGPQGRGSLDDRVKALLKTRGFAADDLHVTMFTMPRVLGYAFNPLTLFFAHDAQGVLQAMIYEVSNTFGERHHYVLATDPRAQVVRQNTAKAFHVSPFLPMDLSYRFLLKAGAERLMLAIQDRDAEGVVLSATFNARHEPLTGAALIRQFFSLPLMTVKVILGIHWEAVLLFLKGLKIFPHIPVSSPEALKSREPLL